MPLQYVETGRRLAALLHRLLHQGHAAVPVILLLIFTGHGIYITSAAAGVVIVFLLVLVLALVIVMALAVEALIDVVLVGVALAILPQLVESLAIVFVLRLLLRSR